MQAQAKDYWRLFKPSACSLKLKATTQEGVFQEVVSIFVKAKMLDEGLRESAVRALLQREGLASTGVGMHVAVPHVKIAGLEEPAFSLCIQPKGLDWCSVDDEPVRIFFVVLRPERGGAKFDPDRHLDMMKWVSGLARKADFRRFAQAVSTRKALVDLLKEMSD